jgi:prephenate dehydrogenase
VCPPSPTAPLEPLCALSAALDPLGTRMLVCDAAAHDAAVARTSHVPHVVAQALARAPAGGLAAALTGGAYRDMTRTATADERLWRAILFANRGPVAAALRELADELRRLAAAIERGDAEPLRGVWLDGARVRARAEALRWEAPAWTRETLAPPAWHALLELGRQGRTLRRPRLAAGALELEVTPGLEV